jgi:hypothetical protein
MLFAFGIERVLLLERKLPPKSKWKISFADACFSKICKKDGSSYVNRVSNSTSYAAKEPSLELHERRRSSGDTSSDTSNMLLHVQGGMQKLSIPAAAVSYNSAQYYQKMENSSSAASEDNSDISKIYRTSSDSKAEGSWRRQQPLPPPDRGRILQEGGGGEEGSARVQKQYVNEYRNPEQQQQQQQQVLPPDRFSKTSSQWKEKLGRPGENHHQGTRSDKKSNSSCSKTNPSSFPPRPQLDGRAYAVKKFFDKLMMSPEPGGVAVILSGKQDAAKFVASMVAYDPKIELLYHMVDEKKLGRRRISEVASLVASLLDVKELVFPMLQCFLDPALEAPMYKRSRDSMLTQLYQLPFFIETFVRCLSHRDDTASGGASGGCCSEKESELVVQFLSILSLSLVEARSSPAIRTLVSCMMSERSTNISGMERLCDILMIKRATIKKAPGSERLLPSGGSKYDRAVPRRNYFGASDRAPPGGRHNNDFVNYRDIAIVPTSEEVACPLRPYLPLASKENRFAAIPSNSAFLLDSQFRLLREDFLSPLKQAALSDKKLFGGTPIDLHLNQRPCIVFKFDRPAFKSRNEDEIVNLSDFWAKFRGLEFDSLVSLQRNGETVRYGTIAMSGGGDEQTWLDHPDGPRIGLEFERKEDLFATLNDLWDLEQCVPYELVPASQSFFSYRSVLSCLQKMTVIPLEEEIVDGTSTNGRPDYIPQIVMLPPELGSVRLDLNAWRDTGLTSLDQSQRDALRLALTTRVAIIQGPPGWLKYCYSYSHYHHHHHHLHVISAMFRNRQDIHGLIDSENNSGKHFIGKSLNSLQYQSRPGPDHGRPPLAGSQGYRSGGREEQVCSHRTILSDQPGANPRHPRSICQESDVEAAPDHG